MSPRSLPAGAPCHFSSKAETVGAVPETSNTRPSFTTTGVGPSPISMRPTSTASRQSCGRGKALLVMAILHLDLQGVADIGGGDAGAFLGSTPRRSVQFDIQVAAPGDGFEIGDECRKVHAAFAQGIEIGIVHH